MDRSHICACGTSQSFAWPGVPSFFLSAKENRIWEVPQTLPFVQGRQHYGEVVFISLPQSQLTVQVSTAVFTVMRADKERGTRIVPGYKVAQEKSDTDRKIDTVEMSALDLLEKQLQK